MGALAPAHLTSRASGPAHVLDVFAVALLYGIACAERKHSSVHGASTRLGDSASDGGDV